MKELPDEIYYKIFGYIFKEKYLIFLKDLKLQIQDYTTICCTLYYKLQTLKQFIKKTSFWRVKNHTTNINISADSDEEGEGALSIYEIKFNNSFKQTRMAIIMFKTISDHNKSEEFITDNFKKSKKVLENIKILGTSK